MKRRFATLLMTLTLFSLHAQVLDTMDYSAEEIDEPAKQAPFTLTGDVDAVRETKIKRGFRKGDHFRFAQAEGEINWAFYNCASSSEGANLGLSYTYTAIEWEQNPWFNQNHFETLTLTLGAYTKRIDDWFWQTQLSANADLIGWNFNDYMTYDYILWGRYNYRKNIGIHIGLFAQTGMQMDRVYPILGADWHISSKWKLNVVFPVNVSLEYQINQNWSVLAAGRSFNSRHRIDQHDGQNRSVVRYENIGAELAVKLQTSNMIANFHAGTTLGGRFRVADRHNDHPCTYRLEASPYVGGEVTMRF